MGLLQCSTVHLHVPWMACCPHDSKPSKVRVGVAQYKGQGAAQGGVAQYKGVWINFCGVHVVSMHSGNAVNNTCCRLASVKLSTSLRPTFSELG